MTPVDTLTDRYVGAALRRLPARQHTDIDRELRASIADAVEDRVSAGVEPAAAEQAVLTDLGDPARLAAGYADRPLHLIGPALYPDYTRLLTALLATVVPAVAVAVGVAGTVSGDTAPHVLGDTVGVAVTTAVHLAVWTTLVFAVIERAPHLRWTPVRPWTLAALPPPPARPGRRGELVAQSVLVVLGTIAVLLSPMLGSTTGTGGPLAPWLWHTATVYALIALAIVTLGVSFAKRYLPWSATVTVTDALVKLAGAGTLIVLAASAKILNPTFVAAAHRPAMAPQWTDTGVIVLATIGAAYTVFQALVELSTRSWSTPRLGNRIRTVVDGVSGVRPR